MKKLLILLTVTVTIVMMSVLGFAGVVNARATGATRFEVTATEDAIEGSSARAVINQNANGDYIVVVQVRSAQPDQWMILGVGSGWRVAEFQTNEVGNATVQVILIVGNEYHGEVFYGIGGVIQVRLIDEPGASGGDRIFRTDIPEL